jgi:hypothetical protein
MAKHTHVHNTHGRLRARLASSLPRCALASLPASPLRPRCRCRFSAGCLHRCCLSRCSLATTASWLLLADRRTASMLMMLSRCPPCRALCCCCSARVWACPCCRRRRLDVASAPLQLCVASGRCCAALLLHTPAASRHRATTRTWPYVGAPTQAFMARSSTTQRAHAAQPSCCYRALLLSLPALLDAVRSQGLCLVPKSGATKFTVVTL